jgi:hypothetical protein
LQLFEQEENEVKDEVLVAAEQLETATTCLDIAKKAQLHRSVATQVDKMLEAYGAEISKDLLTILNAAVDRKSPMALLVIISSTTYRSSKWPSSR